MSTEPRRGSAEHRGRVEQQLREYNQLLVQYEDGLKKANDQQERSQIENNIQKVKAQLKDLENDLTEINKGNKPDKY